MDREDMLKWLSTGAPALSLSLQKWRDIQEEVAERIELRMQDIATCGVPIEYSGETCALCETHGIDDCDECIIRESTGLDQCQATPFISFNITYTKGNLHAMKEAADAEVEFLEYLEHEEKRKDD